LASAVRLARTLRQVSTQVATNCPSVAPAGVLPVEGLVFAEVDQGPKGDGGQRGHVPHRQTVCLEQAGEDRGRDVVAALDQLLMHQHGQIRKVGTVALQ
jgi:hypothetical protein